MKTKLEKYSIIFLLSTALFSIQFAHGTTLIRKETKNLVESCGKKYERVANGLTFGGGLGVGTTGAVVLASTGYGAALLGTGIAASIGTMGGAAAILGVGGVIGAIGVSYMQSSSIINGAAALISKELKEPLKPDPELIKTWKIIEKDTRGKNTLRTQQARWEKEVQAGIDREANKFTSTMKKWKISPRKGLQILVENNWKICNHPLYDYLTLKRRFLKWNRP